MSGKRNKYDSNGCMARGKKTEEDFKELARSRNLLVVKSSKDEDINKHFDFILSKGKGVKKIEIKGMKRICRRDKSVQDDWHWIELHGVRMNDLGWLYGGSADFLAFETAVDFIFVERTILIKLVEEKVELNSIVRFPEEARYKVYNRVGRHDKITLIETKLLREISSSCWEKNYLPVTTN